MNPELPAQEPRAELKGDDAAPAIRTFLIADVRGYTLFTQERGDEAAAMLAARFAAIAREGVESSGGHVIELRGDEALAVFGSARQAIRAAVDLQKRFVEETIADPSLPLPVGIGLDAGEAVPVERGYRGGALNLAARLCGQAGPGETLASQEVVHLARKVEGVRYVDRGELRLKGLDEAVRAIKVLPEEGDPALLLAPYAPKPSARVKRRRPSRIPSWALPIAALLVAGALAASFLAFRSNAPSALPSSSPPTSRSNNLWRIDPDSARRIATTSVGNGPGAVAIGEGSVWVANLQGDAVSRIDPVTNRAVSIKVGNGSAAITVAQGSAWVVVPDAKAVVRIDPDSNKAGPPIALGARPVGITAGNGSVWVADCDGIAQIDPTTSTLVKRFPLPGGCGQMSRGIDGPIAVTHDSAWLTEFDHVVRVNLTTGQVTDVTPQLSAFCDIGASPDAVWILGCTTLGIGASFGDGPAPLFRVNPDTARAEPPITVQNGGRWLALGSNQVWVLSSKGSISRIQLLDDSVHPFGQAGRSVGGIAVGDGSLWISVDVA